MTPAREAVLEALETSSEPLTAAGVLARIEGRCDQATVYRALGYLEKKGCALSFILHCDREGTERYYVAAGATHHHWFHCESCHRFVDLGICQIGELTSELEREFGVRVRRHTLYFSGFCAECRRSGRARDHGDAEPPGRCAHQE